jgi:DASH complex subunit DAD1
VGNEFSSVEALWSQFENVMAQDPEEGTSKPEEQGDGHDEGDQTKNEEEGEGGKS